MNVTSEKKRFSAFEQSPESHVNGVGLVRYVLALMVVLHHFGDLTGADVHSPVPIRAVVGSFFALSGFFAFRSVRRAPSDLFYLKSRICRIYPPYAGIIVLCALFMAVFSSFSLGHYFSDAGFWKYLLANLCFLNYLQPVLPGVFDGWSIPAVNGSLWFMKIEIAFCLFVPLLFFAGKRWEEIKGRCRFWNKNVFRSDYGQEGMAVYVSWLYVLVLALCLFLELRPVGSPYFDAGRHLVFYLWFFQLFLLGGLFYEKYHVFARFRFSGAVLCVVTLLLRHEIVCYDLWLQPLVISWLLFCAAFALHGSLAALLNVLNLHNISYGIFLVHFPVIQVLRHFTGDIFPLWALFVSTVGVTLLLAELFYRYLERPFMSHSKNKP